MGKQRGKKDQIIENLINKNNLYLYNNKMNTYFSDRSDSM